jgi:hypothetical protein
MEMAPASEPALRLLKNTPPGVRFGTPPWRPAVLKPVFPFQVLLLRPGPLAGLDDQAAVARVGNDLVALKLGGYGLGRHRQGLWFQWLEMV